MVDGATWLARLLEEYVQNSRGELAFLLSAQAAREAGIERIHLPWWL